MKRLTFASVLLMAAMPCAVMAGSPQVIKFGVDPTFPPFESKAPDGSIVGFDVELGKAICADLHAKCEWVEQSFDGMIPALKARKFDAVLSAMVATPVRREQIDFTNRLYAGPSRLVARAGVNLQPTAESLRGKRIGVQQGTAQEAFARQEWAPGGANIVTYQNQDQVYEDLANGRLDAAFQPVVQADLGFLKLPHGKGFAFVGTEVKDRRVSGDGVAIGIRKDDHVLASQINQAIANIRKSGEYDRIDRKYFDFDIYGE
ncbi:ABC transporter substrate-binding protein [Paraburkholderia flagellata]|uniref:ABC transporter substrate-binding protein n=1 Tax=Paraburkholderia flagellata TaxID=2883241 RepID=UPI001F2BA675|nr:ABC transporter substrate-binding protein [Paraburkholderia flagellata]